MSGELFVKKAFDADVLRLAVSPSWTRLERVPDLHGVIGLQPAGDRVIGWRWRFNELVSIDQTGRVRVITFKQRTGKE